MVILCNEIQNIMINVELVNVSLPALLLLHSGNIKLHVGVESAAAAKMNFDSLLSEINGFGTFQIQLVLIQALSRVTLPCHFLLNNFMAAVPDHHCNVLGDGGLFGNLTQEQKLGIPAGPDGTPSSCLMFTKPQYEHLAGFNSSDEAFTVQCQKGWVYDNSTYKSTLATEVSVAN